MIEEEHPAERTPSEARAGSVSGRVRTILIVSAGAAFILLILVWIISAFVAT